MADPGETFAEHVTRLDRMLANLQAHIDQRAAELADPIIASAREAAAVEVKGALGLQQRAEDLNVELRRQLAVREGHNQRYQGRAAAVRAWHPPVGEGLKRCRTCGVAWPCPTIRALDGTDPQGFDHG